MVVQRVGLIGAGRIAQVHLYALMHTPSVRVTAVVDPNGNRATAIAKIANSDVRTFDTVEEAIESNSFDRAHVLVPPNLHEHIGKQILDSGVHCLMEKPICVTSLEAKHLLTIADANNLILGVNQNCIFHPAFLKFKRELDAGYYGQLRFVSLVVGVPLPQMQRKQFNHWMFERSSNIILEQMIHPLSQIIHLTGHAEVEAVVTSPSKEIAPGINFHKSFDVSLKGVLCNAQLHMAFSENFTVWLLTAVCDDGVIVVDCVKNSVTRHKRTRFLEAADIALNLAKQGLTSLAQSIGGIGSYLGSQLSLLPRSDAFFLSVQGCVHDFHRSVDVGLSPISDGSFGANLVDLCLKIANKANLQNNPAPNPSTLLADDASVPHYDVAVFGGTGFIGKFVVWQLLEAGYNIGVIGRSLLGLPNYFNNPRVTIIRGDVTNRADIVRGIGTAKYVVNLAHGGGGTTRQEITESLAGSAKMVAEVCLEKRVERIIFISSIAALYLGNSNETIKHSTLYDTQTNLRSDYSHAKAEAERILLGMH